MYNTLCTISHMYPVCVYNSVFMICVYTHMCSYIRFLTNSNTSRITYTQYTYNIYIYYNIHIQQSLPIVPEEEPEPPKPPATLQAWCKKKSRPNKALRTRYFVLYIGWYYGIFIYCACVLYLLCYMFALVYNIRTVYLLCFLHLVYYIYRHVVLLL